MDIEMIIALLEARNEPEAAEVLRSMRGQDDVFEGLDPGVLHFIPCHQSGVGLVREAH